MNLKALVLIMIGTTLVGAGGFVFALFYINPFDAQLSGLYLFYASLFVFLAGFTTLGGILLQFLRKPASLRSMRTLCAFRQGVIVSTVALVAIVLAHGDLLNWWNGPILIVLAYVVEVFFSSREKPHAL